jgi:N-acetyl-gamma-glutamyl-phosphate reductase
MLYPQLAGNGGFPFESFSWQRMKSAGVDVVFFATPHEFSREQVPEAISRGFRVIDLSGAWRLKQEANRKVYGFAESASQLDDSAVYGLPELHADAIKHATLLANPGCYSTSIILGLAPWIRAGHRPATRYHLRFEVRGFRGGEAALAQNALRRSIW